MGNQDFWNITCVVGPQIWCTVTQLKVSERISGHLHTDEIKCSIHMSIHTVTYFLWSSSAAFCAASSLQMEASFSCCKPSRHCWLWYNNWYNLLVSAFIWASRWCKCVESLLAASRLAWKLKRTKLPYSKLYRINYFVRHDILWATNGTVVHSDHNRIILPAIKQYRKCKQ